MKKLSLVLVIAFAFVAMLSGTALAEQAKVTASGDVYYNSTTALSVYEAGSLSRLKQVNKFVYDGVTNYPYEIYLPNENPANYRIHTNYTNDTDACASCHATHTAVGAALLQWYTTYDTCIACHDGTVTTTYNVVGGKIGTSQALAYGGMFGTTSTGDTFMSNHNVTGALSISAAPGGSTVGVERTTDMGKVITQWQTTFGCESCHSPHGQGGNARILHPDANGVATQKKAASYTTVEYPASSGEYAVLVNNSPVLFLVGYPYKVTVDGGTFLGNSAGYSKFSAAGLTVEGTPSLKVTMNISGYLTGSESVTHVSGMNAFCGACHTDYNTENFVKGSDGKGSGSVANGTFSKAMRHAVGNTWNEFFVASPAPTAKIGADKYMQTESGKITCLTCHVAHGVTADYWSRALTKYNTGDTVFGNWTDKLKEIAGSSALKRLPNMATCEACHEKGAAAEGYNALTSQSPSVVATTYEIKPFDANGRFWNSPLNNTTKFMQPQIYAAGYDWAGSATCEKCHKEYYDGWKSTKHYKLMDPVANYSAYQAAWNPTTPVYGWTVGGQTYYGQNNPAGVAAYPFKIENGVFSVNTSTSPAGTDINTVTFANNFSWTDFGSKSWVWMSGNADTSAAGAGVVRNTGNTTSSEMQRYASFTKADLVNAANKPAGTYLLRPFLSSNIPTVSSGIGSSGCTFGVGCHFPLAGVARGEGTIATTRYQDMNVGCEICHAPGNKHIMNPSSTNILNPATRLNQKQQVGDYTRTAINGDGNGCLKCHMGRASEHYAISDFQFSGHFKSGVLTCTTCHDVHKESMFRTTSVNNLCASCHEQIFNVSSLMPVNQTSASGLQSSGRPARKSHALGRALPLAANLADNNGTAAGATATNFVAFENFTLVKFNLTSTTNFRDDEWIATGTMYLADSLPNGVTSATLTVGSQSVTLNAGATTGINFATLFGFDATENFGKMRADAGAGTSITKEGTITANGLSIPVRFEFTVK